MPSVQRPTLTPQSRTHSKAPQDREAHRRVHPCPSRLLTTVGQARVLLPWTVEARWLSLAPHSATRYPVPLYHCCTLTQEIPDSRLERSDNPGKTSGEDTKCVDVRRKLAGCEGYITPTMALRGPSPELPSCLWPP